MEKKFFDVFPVLKLDAGLHDLYEQVTVERVSSTRNRDFLRVYISSDRLIQKDEIYAAEDAIKKQLFPDASMLIKIYERFHMSAQYTPERLMRAYQESILLELRNYSPVEYSLFHKADLAFPEPGILSMTLEESMLGRTKAGGEKRPRGGRPQDCHAGSGDLRKSQAV